MINCGAHFGSVAIPAFQAAIDRRISRAIARQNDFRAAYLLSMWIVLSTLQRLDREMSAERLHWRRGCITSSKNDTVSRKLHDQSAVLLFLYGSYTVAPLTLDLLRPDNKVGVRSLQKVGIEMSNKYGGWFVYGNEPGPTRC